MGGDGGSLPELGVDVAIHHRLLRMSAFIGEASVIRLDVNEKTTGEEIVATLLELNPLFDDAFRVGDYGLVLASWTEFAELECNPAEYPLVDLSVPILPLLEEHAASAALEESRTRKRRK